MHHIGTELTELKDNLPQFILFTSSKTPFPVKKYWYINSLRLVLRFFWLAMKLSVLKGGARAKRHRAAKDFCEGPHGPRVFLLQEAMTKKHGNIDHPLEKKNNLYIPPK